MRVSAIRRKLRRRRVSALALTLALFCSVVFFISSPGQAVMTAALARKLPIYCVQKTDKAASLTFDAAWGNEDTQQLIDILGRYGVRATFFVVGEWAEKYPESVKALADAGHEIMNHSASHAHYPKLTAEQMAEDLKKCNEAVAAITGKTPDLFRPPYGDYNDAVITAVEKAGMYAIQWDVDSLDWKNPTPAAIAERVLSRAGAGSIILFHNAAKNTPAALPQVIEGLLARGFTLMPVSELILRTDYAIDHTGRQISAAGV